jgi:hypothetical protein
VLRNNWLFWLVSVFLNVAESMEINKHTLIRAPMYCTVIPVNKILSFGNFKLLNNVVLETL